MELFGYPLRMDVMDTIPELHSRIYSIRGRRVMLDYDLAVVYGVTTGRLNEQVKRNNARFPQDFMFQLTKKELRNWVSQSAIPNSQVKMGVRLDALEKKYDVQFRSVFQAIRELMDPPIPSPKKIGFQP